MELWCQDVTVESTDSSTLNTAHSPTQYLVHPIKLEGDGIDSHSLYSGHPIKQEGFDDQYVLHTADHSDDDEEDSGDGGTRKGGHNITACFPSSAQGDSQANNSGAAIGDLTDQYDGDTDTESPQGVDVSPAANSSSRRKLKEPVTGARSKGSNQGLQRRSARIRAGLTQRRPRYTDDEDPASLTLPALSTLSTRTRQSHHQGRRKRDNPSQSVSELSADFAEGLLADCLDDVDEDSTSDSRGKKRGSRTGHTKKKRVKSEPGGGGGGGGGGVVVVVEDNSHDNPMLYVCGVCDKAFTQGEKLKRHVWRSQHSGVVRCGKCGESRASVEELVAHGRQHAVRPFHCDQCPACFSSSTHLKRHSQTHGGEKRHKCQQCPAAFHQLVNLTVHMRSHTGEKPYRCDQCSAAFTLSSNLKRHRRTHTGEKPYQCDVCNKAFSVSSQLKVHYRIHTGEKMYKCPQCPAAFIQSSSLKSHINLHKGVKPYRCELCPAAFVESTNLKVHMRTHSGERPFLCEQCPRAFTQSSSLKKHRLIHSGERSFQCQHCPKTFRLPHGLKRHLLIHSEDRHFRCQHCPAKFLKEDYLRAHMFLHNGQKPWLKKRQMAVDSQVLLMSADGEDVVLSGNEEVSENKREGEGGDKHHNTEENDMVPS